MKRIFCALSFALFTKTFGLNAQSIELTKPIVGSNVIFNEENGMIAFEAEHFYKQSKTENRQWYITSSSGIPDIIPDADSVHLVGVSGGAYIEVLPDSRQNHDERLIHGENFSDKAGEMAILHYNVHFSQTGRYYVWIRAFSTNSEDDAVHLGFEGDWPESGMRWRTIVDHQWAWQNKKRYPASAKKHGSMKSWLDVDAPGQRVLQISMREDGAELDKIVLTLDENYIPEGEGPVPKLFKGQLPPPFKGVESGTRAL